jgi:fructose-1,6-bisphosphatase I
MAFIVEQAGGRATNGKKRIMEIEPDKLHQRCPIFIGSEEDVKIVEKFMAEAEVTVGS